MGFEYEHKATSGENLLWELGHWCSEYHESFPILYLANYSDSDLERFAKYAVSPPMADKLRKSAHPCAIHFGPTHDLNEMANVYYGSTRFRSDNTTSERLSGRPMVGRLLKEILEATGAVSVSGYLSGYLDGKDWLEGTISDLRLFYNLIHTVKWPTSHISSELREQAGKYVNHPSFVMQTPDGHLLHRPRRPTRRSTTR